MLISTTNFRLTKVFLILIWVCICIDIKTKEIKGKHLTSQSLNSGEIEVILIDQILPQRSDWVSLPFAALRTQKDLRQNGTHLG